MTGDHEGERARGRGARRPRAPAAVRLTVLALALAALTALPASAQARDGDDADRSGLQDVLVEPRQRRAVDRALAWIAARQQKGGMWGEKKGTRVADTALSVLALMAGGSTVCAGPRLDDGGDGPEKLRGPHALQVREGLMYLASRALANEPDQAPGYIQDDENSKMHGHGFATLALASACGNLGATDMSKIRARLDQGANLSFAERVRYGLERAVQCIDRAQDKESGGWSYWPRNEAGGHEGSMTVTQILALRAAMDAGVRVNGKVMKDAYEYVRKSQVTGSAQHRGGFAYMMSLHERVSYGLTAAALTTFFGLGKYGTDKGDREIIRLGLEYMDKKLEEVVDKDAQWFYYNLFYGAQTLYLSADERRIRDQWPRIRKAILDRQQPDGMFEHAGPTLDIGGVEYSTAIACLTLQVPMESLPIFQRR